MVAAGAAAYKMFFPHSVPPEAAKTVMPTKPKKAAAPVVLLFSADRGSPGKPPSLRWDVQNADGVFIDPEVGPVASSGSVDLKSATTTAYQRNASGPGGNVTATVEMVAPPPGGEQKPSAFAVPPGLGSWRLKHWQAAGG